MKKSVLLSVLLSLFLISCAGGANSGSSSDNQRNGQGDQPNVESKPPEQEKKAVLLHVVGKNRAIEFYHHDPKQCDGEASPVNSWLGNFHIVPNGVEVDTGIFKTAEAAFQAGKCLAYYGDWYHPDYDACIDDYVSALDGEEAFQKNKKYPLNQQQANYWDKIKVTRMKYVIEGKFSKSNPDLLQALCATKGTPLIETIPESRTGNAGAIYWGQAPAKPGRPTIGQNILGKMLEQYRERVCP